MYNQIKHLYPNAEAQVDFELRDDSQGAGVYIHRWDAIKLGPQPTAAQFAAVKVAADLQVAANTSNAAAKAKLLGIDLKSIRAIREYIASKADAPAFLKALEADSLIERGKIK